MGLKFKEVFDKYETSYNQRLSECSYALYEKLCRKLKKTPILGFLDDKYSLLESSHEMPKGFSILKNQPEDGYINLQYIDLYDYLPKEDLDKYLNGLDKYAVKNAIISEALSHHHKTAINNMEVYLDGTSFTQLKTIKFKSEKLLSENFFGLSISLRNLSSTFLLVRYKFAVLKENNEEFNKILKKHYDSKNNVFHTSKVCWFQPHKFGRCFDDGDDLRHKEIYEYISTLKWKAFCEIENNLGFYFAKHDFFPPIFETYSTNIRPSKSYSDQAFWRSVGLTSDTDYSIKYNACINWEYTEDVYKALQLQAYCGGPMSDDVFMYEYFEYHISEEYAVYIVASSMNQIALRDIAICNKKISASILKKRTTPALKARIYTKKKLYYTYRFLTEFSEKMIFSDLSDSFKNPRSSTNSSLSKSSFKYIPEKIKETKRLIDNLFSLLNEVADYKSSKSNMSLQWFMMIITILSLFVAMLSTQQFEFDLSQLVKDFLNQISRFFV